MGTEQDTGFPRHVAGRLATLAREHKVVGASLAVLHRGEIVAEAATGHANLAAGVEATPETVFQIGSITNVWTATLAFTPSGRPPASRSCPSTTWPCACWPTAAG